MKKILILFPLVFLTGCLGNKNEIKDDAVFLQSVPVCSSEDVCNKMWKAAGEWVDRYSPQGIETYNDQLIRSEEKEIGSEEMEIEVRKIKQDDGTYKIVIDNFCRRSGGSCAAERSNMIAFNKTLYQFMPVQEKTLRQDIFKDNQTISQWFDRYSQLVAGYKTDALASMMHFPVTFIENDNIQTISSTNDLEQYLQVRKKQFDELKGTYLKTDSIDVFQHIGRNVYVNAILNLYDVENTVVAAQQLAFHLVEVDGKWLLISTAVHTK